MWSKKLDFIADQPRKLYKAVGAEANLSFFETYNLKSIKAVFKIRKEMKAFKKLGKEDGINQRPIDILIDSKDGKVVAVKYGKNISDRWSVDEVVALAKQYTAA